MRKERLTVATMWAVAWMLGSIACGGDDEKPCTRDTDCAPFHRCIDHACQVISRPNDAGTLGDAGRGRDAAVTDAGREDGGLDAGTAGACDNPVDRDAFVMRYGAAMDTPLWELTRQCTTGCASMGRPASEWGVCAAMCVLEMTPITSECSACVEVLVQCGATRCFACASGTDPMCGVCLCMAPPGESSCEAQFRSCAGVPSPYPYEGMGVTCP